jgi:hypothetical protein
MADALSNVTQILGFGLLAGAAYVAYNALKDSGLTEAIDYPIEIPQKWCDSLGRNIDASLTCPRSADPYVEPVHITCPDGFVNQNEVCVRIPGTEPIPSVPYIPGYVGWCQWPNGDPLSVPVGMDCVTAVDDMCRRFGSGYKGCP